MILVDGVVPSWFQIVGMFSFWERNIQIRTVAITVLGPTFVSARFPDFLVSLQFEVYCIGTQRYQCFQYIPMK